MKQSLNTVYVMFLILAVPSVLIALDPPSDNNDWTSVQQALERADQEEKLILIDVYAAWCPYCQRMQENVYPDERIEVLIDSYFIPVRINIESSREEIFLGTEFSQEEFARALGFQNVPTTFFMNSDGEVVGQQPGYLPVDVFSSLLEYVGSGAYESMSFNEFEERQ